MKNWLQALFNELDSLENIPALHIQYGENDDYVDFYRGKKNPLSHLHLNGHEQWHIGSCGKAITAHMLTKLIEEGLLSYDRVVFGDISLADLLCHQSGIPNQYPEPIWIDLIQSDLSVNEKRGRVFNFWSSQTIKKNKTYCYSNWNYLLAAIFASHQTGLTFENLMEKYIPYFH